MDTTALIPLDPMTSADRCDSCNAQAYVRVFLQQGDLLFCAHHFKENEEYFRENATRIQDEMFKLEPSKPEPEDVE